MRESCTYGVVRGALSNERPYRDHHCLGRHQNASVIGQRRAGFSPGSADRNHQLTRDTWWISPSLRPGLGFWYTRASVVSAAVEAKGRKPEEISI
jgi:hypothetical protein